MRKTKTIPSINSCCPKKGIAFSLSGRIVSGLFSYIILLMSIPLIGFAQESVDYNSLTEQNGIYSKINSNTPFTGLLYSLYDNGKLFLEGEMADGKWNWSISYYRSGQKQFEDHYENGVQHGTQLWWYENGQLKSSQSYEDGILDGPFIAWWPDGKIMSEYTYNEGMRVGQ